jgi:hypothetical protein
MKTFIRILRAFGIVGLVLILTFSILYASGTISMENFKILILFSSILWFTAILLSNLLNRKQKAI